MEYFWCNNFLNRDDKRVFDCNVKLAVYLHYLGWIIAAVLIGAEWKTSYTPAVLQLELFPYWLQLAVVPFQYLSLWFGHYVVQTHECFFAYTILHGYFQLKTVSAYMRYEFFKYNKMSLKEKLHSFEYQSVIGGVLLRSIKQHKRLAECVFDSWWNYKVNVDFSTILDMVKKFQMFTTSGCCYIFLLPSQYFRPLDFVISMWV